MERIQLPSNVVPEHYEIFVRPDAANLRFEGTVKIRIRIVEATSAIVLNAADLQISRAVLASRSEQAGISLNGETATLKFERPIELGVEEPALLGRAGPQGHVLPLGCGSPERDGRLEHAGR